MAKKREICEVEVDIFAGLAKDLGANLLDDLDKSRGFIDTGVLSLNFIASGKFVGGGLATEAMAEISGENGTGKSLVGTNLLRGCQTANGIPVLHDAECAVSKDFAIKASHVDPKKLLVTDADTLEKSFNKIHKVIRQVRQTAKIPLERPLVIVYDSIAVSPSEREFAWTGIDIEEATDKQIKDAGAGTEKPGERARICSSELRKLMPIVKENNVCILFINQLRDRIGVSYGDPKTEAGGGQSLRYYCSTRLRMSSYKQLKDKAGKISGTNVTLKNIKSRFTAPFKEARNVRLDFEHGIDPFGGLLELMLQIGRLEPTGTVGYYRVLEPWAGGKEIKFKSSKERNDIPLQVLLDCPKLVDAQTPEQIEYYQNMFGAANEAVNMENIIEEDLKDNDN